MAVGLVRVRADGNTYEPGLGTALLDALIAESLDVAVVGEPLEVVVGSEHIREVLAATADRYVARTGLVPTVWLCRAASGAGPLES